MNTTTCNRSRSKVGLFWLVILENFIQAPGGSYSFRGVLIPLNVPIACRVQLRDPVYVLQVSRSDKTVMKSNVCECIEVP